MKKKQVKTKIYPKFTKKKKSEKKIYLVLDFFKVKYHIKEKEKKKKKKKIIHSPVHNLNTN